MPVLASRENILVLSIPDVAFDHFHGRCTGPGIDDIGDRYARAVPLFYRIFFPIRFFI